MTILFRRPSVRIAVLFVAFLSVLAVPVLQAQAWKAVVLFALEQLAQAAISAAGNKRRVCRLHKRA